MKAIIYITTGLLTFSFSALFATDVGFPGRFVTTAELTPSIPVEATFEESVPEPENSNTLILMALAPSTPNEADFTEEGTTNSTLLKDLSPEAPKEADFNDSI